MGDIVTTSVDGVTSTISIDQSVSKAIFDTGTSVTYLSLENAEKLNVGKLKMVGRDFLISS